MSQVMSGQLVAPSVPTTAETMEMQRLVDTYGKTFHTWQVLDQAYDPPLASSVYTAWEDYARKTFLSLIGMAHCNATIYCSLKFLPMMLLLTCSAVVCRDCLLRHVQVCACKHCLHVR